MATSNYQLETMTRADVDAASGAMLIVFGVNWCPHCQAGQAPLEQAMAGKTNIKCVQIEDGKGRALGRSFGVKLWPTAILMKSGQEIGRVVRPTQARELEELLARC